MRLTDAGKNTHRKGNKMKRSEIKGIISALNTHVKWIKDIPEHHFAGYEHTTEVMNNAIKALEEYCEVKDTIAGILSGTNRKKQE